MTYVEILSRHGRLRDRHRLERLPAIIGRAYDCDVLVDDEFVSPRHLRLEADADGVPVAVDLDSKNGVYALHPSRKVARFRLTPDAELRIGRTLLRVRTAESPVDDAKTDTLRESKAARWFESPFGLALAALAMATAIAIAAVVPDYSDQELLRLIIGEALPIVTGMFFWIGIWAIASRIATHQFFLAPHTNIACSFIAATGALALLQQIWRFSFADSPLAEQSFAAIWWLAFAALLWAHLQYVTSWSRRRTTAVALVVSGFLTVVSLLGGYAQRDTFSGSPDYNATLMPAEFKLRAGISRSDLSDEVARLQREVDADAEPRPPTSLPQE